MKEIPAISVVIPMYNVEKYIGDCLDSILNQTFQDFEVIVVDDCSTDNSRAIVESYAEKFGGRLILTKTKKNSGGAGFPRNKGIELSRGKYIYFFDSDDLITPTALEELYLLAETFNADVVHCERFYFLPEEFCNDAEFIRQLKPDNYFNDQNFLVSEPLLWDNNFEERINLFIQRKLLWNVVIQLIRRDFIIDNEIRFCDTFSEDMIFFICELCTAKRFVMAPNAFYYYRRRQGSATTNKQTDLQLLQRQAKTLRVGVNYLDEFLSGYEFFSQRPDLKYTLLSAFAGNKIAYLGDIYNETLVYELDELLRKEFAGENAALTSLIFNKMNLYRVDMIAAKERIAELESELKLITELVLEYKRIAKL